MLVKVGGKVYFLCNLPPSLSSIKGIVSFENRSSKNFSIIKLCFLHQVSSFPAFVFFSKIASRENEITAVARSCCTLSSIATVDSKIFLKINIIDFQSMTIVFCDRLGSLVSLFPWQMISFIQGCRIDVSCPRDTCCRWFNINYHDMDCVPSAETLFFYFIYHS